MWALEHWGGIEVIEHYTCAHQLLKDGLFNTTVYLSFLSGAWCCIFNLQTNINKTIIQLIDTTSKTAKTPIAITLMSLSSVSLLWLFSFSVSCDDLTVTYIANHDTNHPTLKKVKVLANVHSYTYIYENVVAIV